MGADLSSTEKIVYVVISVCLVLIAGMMSGLTLGLMSLDTIDLEVSTNHIELQVKVSRTFRLQ
jgi:hypothetical protein